MDFGAAKFFKNEFRQALLKAQEDAENFKEILFVTERLGFYLFSQKDEKGIRRKGYGTLNRHYKECYEKEFTKYITVDDYSSYEKLYVQVADLRNDAMHQGAYARNLTSHCVKFALQTEGILLNIMEKEKSSSLCVEDLMVVNPLTAQYWQPIDFVRQQMLTNSFSYIPVLYKNDVGEKWYLISEVDIVRELGVDTEDKKEGKKKTVEEIIKIVKVAQRCQETDSLSDVIDKFKKNGGKPILVFKNRTDQNPTGIITPYDLL